MASLRDRWSGGSVTIGAWLTLGSEVSAEVAARSGFDYVCLDNQHGALDFRSSVSMVQAVLAGGGLPICRVPWNEPGIIAKMLDAGCEGVIVPMVNTAEEAAAVVRAGRYPPMGARSYGPVMAGLRRADHHVWAEAGIALIPMIETAEALGNIDAILAVPGIDAVYIGPADLSFSLGLQPQNNDGNELFDAALAAVVAACGRAGVVPGIHATASLAARRIEQGFRMITVSNDMVTLRSGLTHDVAVARGASTAAPDAPLY